MSKSNQRDLRQNTDIGIFSYHDEQISCSVWYEYVKNHPYGTIYHTPAWSDILIAVFGFRAHHLFCIQDGRICGFLPLYTGKGTVLCSSPFRDRGGLIADSNIAAVMLLRAAVAYTESQGYRGIEIKQYEWNYTEPFSTNGFIARPGWVRSLLILNGDAESRWRDIGNKVRGKIRSAQKLGVEFVISDEHDAFRRFYEIFLVTRKRLGVPVYPFALFREINEKLCTMGHVRFMFAWIRRKPVAAMLAFTFGDTVIDAYAGSLPEGFRTKANDFLIWQAILWAMEKKYRVFDFGADEPHLTSLIQYKAKWLAKQNEAAHYSHYPEGEENCLPKFTLRAPLTKIWSLLTPLMPEPIYKMSSTMAIKLLIRAEQV